MSSAVRMGGVDPAAAGPAGRLARASHAGLDLVWDTEALGVAPDLAGLAAVASPDNALETVHWGRNYLWATRIAGSSGDPIEVVVKQFRHDQTRAAWRRRREGSKALKSWRIAWALIERGLPTPAPILLFESQDPRGPSAFVTRRLEGFEEVRYLFRRWNRGEETDPSAAIVIAAIARLARRLHDAGVWFRDLSAGNVMVGTRPTGPGADGVEPLLCLLDLNRARLLTRVSLTQRMRDLARLPAHRPADRELLRQAYFEPEPSRRGAQLRHELFHRTFHGRHRLKQALRGGSAADTPSRAGVARVKGRGLLGLVRARSTYPHLAPPPEGVSTRDRAVWDHLSDQPHHHASPLAKTVVRLVDLGDHARTLASAAAGLPAVLARTRALLASPRTAQLDGLGIAVRPHQDQEALLAAVAELGCHHVLLRVHPWESDHHAEVELAASLSAAGHELLVTLPQNRELVRDPERWRQRIEQIAAEVGPYTKAFQVGQAINRSKWGVWTLGEYLELAADASEILRARVPGAAIVGPAVIDFEPHITVAAVRRRSRELRFDALASLLYVDRRGAPENRQLGWDAEGKAAMMLAIAETSRTCAPHSWVTEVNWPLREGPHSPAGRAVSVDERTQAEYLVRFMLLTHGSGFAERVYWWQLVAKGYGLVDPASGAGVGRKRPAFEAFATLNRELGGARLVRPLETPAGARALLFERRDGAQVASCWSTAGPLELELGSRPDRVVDQNGRATTTASSTIDLDGSVRYAVFERGDSPPNDTIRSRS